MKQEIEEMKKQESILLEAIKKKQERYLIIN